VKIHAIHLAREDAGRLHLLRREALSVEPTAFGSSPASCRFREMAAVEEHLADAHQAVFAVADPDDPRRLVAMAGISFEPWEKRRHRSSIWGVYVSPAHRGHRFGRSVVTACIDHARAWENVEWVALSFSDEGEAARSLYHSLGFTTWGTEPDGIRIDGAAIALHHMLLRLPPEASG
jgi:ribosomal protein S18 acetylase RimI-like enzyme